MLPSMIDRYARAMGREPSCSSGEASEGDYPAPSAAFRRASAAPPGALIPPPPATTAACIEAALAHAERGMAVLRIALAINCSRHLRVAHEKFAIAAGEIEAAITTLRLQAMCADAGEAASQEESHR